MSHETEQTDWGEASRASRRTFVKATGAATAAVTMGAGEAAGSDDDDDGHGQGHGDDGGSIDVDDLLDELTLEQKVGQMAQVAVSTFDPNSDAIPDSFGVDTLGAYFSELGVGSILSGGATPPSFDGQTVVEGINALQEYNLENSEHGIPFLWGVDAVHGNDLLAGATVLPHRINMGATRDIDLIETAEEHTSESTVAMGAHWDFAPTTDLQRDPRWGRFYEGITEDPMLLGEVSKARVRGLQSQDRMAATVKHFGAYSVPENGNDRAHGEASMRDLRTDLLPPYRTALEGDPKTVMVNSGAVNGKPAHASKWLLTDVLRNRYGFEGVILSDYDDFNRMITNHDYVPDFRSAVKAGITAGVDVYMIGNGGGAPGPVQFIDTTVSLVEDGEIDEERIDESVRRILELKADLGVFEEPTVDESLISGVVGGGQDASEQLATESMVLLKNQDEALPLSGDENVLLTGPGANPDPDGGLSWMAEDTRFLMQHGGWTLGWQGVQEGYPSPDGPRPRQNKIVDVLESELGSSAVTHEPTGFYANPYSPATSDPNGDFSFDNEADVRSAAAAADAVVVVLGEGPHNEGFGDRDKLELDPAQQEVVAAVTDEAPDTPVVGVVLAGSPRGTAATFDQLDAVVFAGQSGSDTGRAVVDVLLGNYNPSGKLAFQWPENVGRVPNHYNMYPPLDQHAPLYEFGHGLSYTTFEYSNLSLSQATVEDPEETPTVTVSVDVANTGDVAGDHIVEVYNTQSYGSVLQPNRRLVGFERISLDAGESRTVEVETDLSALEVVPGDVPAIEAKTVEAGDYELTVGDLTTTLTIEESGSITGDGPLASLFDRNDDGRITGRDLSDLIGLLRDRGRGRGDDGDERGRGRGGDGNRGHGRGRGNGRGRGDEEDDDDKTPGRDDGSGDPDHRSKGNDAVTVPESSLGD